MAHGIEDVLVGYRWVASADARKCAKCSQYIYLHPKPGQLSVEEMPDPPLHPNCRCTTEYFTDYHQQIDRELARQRAGRFGKPEEHLEKGSFRFLGGIFCNDDRHWSDGPAYGNYGGKNYTMGRNWRKIEEEYIKSGLLPKEFFR